MERFIIEEKLTTIFRNVFSDDNLVLNDTMTANDVAMWDSLTHMIMITEVEKTFETRFKLKELNKLKSVGDLIDTLSEKL